MPTRSLVGSSKAVGLLGQDQIAKVSNLNSSGTLYVGGQDTVSSSSNTYSIAAGANRTLAGPFGAIGSTDINVLVEELPSYNRSPSQGAHIASSAFTISTTATATATDTVNVAGSAYCVEMYVPARILVTGIGFLIGTTGGTDAATAAIWDSNGVLIASSALAGVLVSTQSTWQELPLTAVTELPIPGKYVVGVGYDGTTAKMMKVTGVNGQKSAIRASVFAAATAPTAITAPTVTTAAAAPLAYLY